MIFLTILQKKLTTAGIPSAVHYPRSLPDQPALHHMASGFPHSELLARTVLSLPMHAYLESTDQDHIVNSLQEALL